MEHQIKSNWHTDRLTILDSVKEDLESLQQIHNACSYIGEWCGDASEPTGKEMQDELRHLELPPNGRAE